MTLALPTPYVVKHGVTDDGKDVASVDADGVQRNLDALAQASPGTGIPRIVSGGKQNIAAAQTTNSLAYTTLATPDTVTVTLATDGLICVWYQALWQNTVGANAKAAIFLGANQLKGGIGTGAPVVQERAGPGDVNDDAVLCTTPNGLGMNAGAGNATEVTTGQIVGFDPATAANFGGPTYIFAAAGTYAVSVQFKNVAAGSVTVSKRHLWVASYAFA